DRPFDGFNGGLDQKQYSDPTQPKPYGENQRSRTICKPALHVQYISLRTLGQSAYRCLRV
ncbi:hypothetical protein, partial [Salmonella enterica]|uniref:hypothetical protein n=1 Tax=Salmonella enterica TaxID=28901 RepID=UPI0022B64FD9